MDIFKQIGELIVHLQEAGYEMYAMHITDALLKGGTDGEKLLIVCSKLLGIQKYQPAVWESISKQSLDILTYARSIGYTSILPTL